MVLQVNNKSLRPASARRGHFDPASRGTGRGKSRQPFSESEIAHNTKRTHPQSGIEFSPPHEAHATEANASAQDSLLVYSPNGLIVVHSDVGHWVVPPTTVLRLLADVEFTIRKAEQVDVRTIVLPAQAAQVLKQQNILYRLTPLLRELLESLSTTSFAFGQSDNTESKMHFLAELLIEAGAWEDDTRHRCKSMPKDPRVAHICNYIYENLDATKTLQEWAAELKYDPRTLHRLFVQEFGMPFVQWRQQTRLMAALEWLAEGRQIMDVALDLGYQTQSAFAAMFRRNMGITPSEWQEKRRSSARRSGYALAESSQV
ncbi:MAG TPA: AraC family transcriptional regulator [Burkholderiaceae bacterium]|nr:AraC family transcriptional regulator [Burkholderiaceae bacterium]